MYTTVISLKRKASMSLEEFLAYYRDIHGPLMVNLMKDKGLISYEHFPVIPLLFRVPIYRQMVQLSMQCRSTASSQNNRVKNAGQILELSKIRPSASKWKRCSPWRQTGARCSQPVPCLAQRQTEWASNRGTSACPFEGADACDAGPNGRRFILQLPRQGSLRTRHAYQDDRAVTVWLSAG